MSAQEGGGRDDADRSGTWSVMGDVRMKLALPVFQVIAGFGLFWVSGWTTWWLAVSAAFVVCPVFEYRRSRKLAMVQLAVGGGFCVVLGLVCAPFIAWSVGGFGP